MKSSTGCGAHSTTVFQFEEEFAIHHVGYGQADRQLQGCVDGVVHSIGGMDTDSGKNRRKSKAISQSAEELIPSPTDVVPTQHSNWLLRDFTKG